MKITVLVLAILCVLSVSLYGADEATLEKAYALYYKGEKETAISMIEDYVSVTPDVKALYFLGYAYYEMKDMDKARQYFDEAYRVKSFYSPQEKKDDQ
jgi:tetratricopeptide (TPR) repeat protein